MNLGLPELLIIVIFGLGMVGAVVAAVYFVMRDREE